MTSAPGLLLAWDEELLDWPGDRLAGIRHQLPGLRVTVWMDSFNTSRPDLAPPPVPEAYMPSLWNQVTSGSGSVRY
jgi:hypothetical protein